MNSLRPFLSFHVPCSTRAGGEGSNDLGRSSSRQVQNRTAHREGQKRRVLHAAAPEDFRHLTKIPEPPFDATEHRGIWLRQPCPVSGQGAYPLWEVRTVWNRIESYGEVERQALSPPRPCPLTSFCAPFWRTRRRAPWGAFAPSSDAPLGAFRALSVRGENRSRVLCSLFSSFCSLFPSLL